MDRHNSPKPLPNHEAVHEERQKLKWFLGFVIVVLLITAGTDLIFSFYGSPNIPTERNPFMTVNPTPTPTSNAAETNVPGSSPSAQPTIILPTNAASPSGTQPKGDVMCTMDAKECPDGTFVGRSGPNCEFVKCPK